MKGENNMDCTDLTKNVIAAVCNKQAVAGTGKRVVLLNYDDVDRVISTVANNVITSLVMKSGKKGVSFTTHGDSTLGEVSLKKGTYVNSFIHNATLRVFTKDEVSKDFVNAIAGSKVIMIIENNEIGEAGNVKYEVYGWESGLELSEATGTTELADGVVYNLKLGTSDKSTENTLPKSYFVTDLTSTETALESLITA